MLDAITELAEHRTRDVGRRVGHEEDADPLRTNQARDELDLLEECLVRIPEQQVRLVEEEDELGPLGVADLRQRGIQTR